MENKSCLAVIKTEYSNLTKKEAQLADYILNNYESVISMTTTELAQNADVVKSVIIRFCRKLNFSGYTEFKLMLSRELARNERLNFNPYISKQDNPNQIMEKIFCSNIKTLHDTMNHIDKKIFSEAVKVLSVAKNVYVYGVGTSAGIASDFRYRLVETGKSAFLFTDIVQMRVSALNIKSSDVVVGVSNSGRTIPTIDALKTARENGAKTICVTSYPKSEIVKYSDFPIVVRTDEIHYPMEAISARIAHISILDSIAVALSAMNCEEAALRAAKNHDLIESIRY